MAADFSADPRGNQVNDIEGVASMNLAIPEAKDAEPVVLQGSNGTFAQHPNLAPVALSGRFGDNEADRNDVARQPGCQRFGKISDQIAMARFDGKIEKDLVGVHPSSSRPGALPLRRVP